MTDETLRNRPSLAVRPRDHAAGGRRLAGQARPPPPDPQPGDVRGRGRRRDHHRWLADPGLRRPAARRRRRAGLVRLLDRRLALADRDLRQLRRGAGRGPGQGPGRRAALDAHRDRRPAARRRREGGLGAAPRRRRRGRGGGGDPRRRHRDRGHRLGRRVGDHRRVGAGRARVRRRPQRRHRRHPRALRPHRRRNHPGARAELPRQDDRPGRGRRAAQDAERDRPQHPPRRPHPRLPRGRRRAAALRRVLRHRCLGRHPDRAARGADPDHDRRPALGDRDRRHGPPRPPQRARPLRALGRGHRRRRRAAARQDRDDHARQPRGDPVHPDAGDRGEGAGRSGAALLARRRDARGPLDRRPRQGVRDPRARAPLPRGALRPLLGRNADERRRRQRQPVPKGRRRRDHRVRRRGRAAGRRPSCRSSST